MEDKNILHPTYSYYIVHYIYNLKIWNHYHYFSLEAKKPQEYL